MLYIALAIAGLFCGLFLTFKYYGQKISILEKLAIYASVVLWAVSIYVLA